MKNNSIEEGTRLLKVETQIHNPKVLNHKKKLTVKKNIWPAKSYILTPYGTLGNMLGILK